MTELRTDLEPLPDRLKKLPVHRGYPVPWFVDWIGDEPEFRAMDGDKWKRAIKDKLCWVCGEPLGRYMTFVAGPMCGINRTSAEPPSHFECAEWSARNCPFLSKPQMERREGGIMEKSLSPAGHMIKRNPGVTLLWTTKAYTLFGDGRGGVLLNIGVPHEVKWYALGKLATRAQVEESVRTGLPKLEEMCRGTDDSEALARMAKDFERYYPK